MAITLPNLEKAACVNLTICGQIQEGAAVCKQVLSKTQSMVAKMQTGARTAYLRVIPYGMGGHLHVDFALSEFFARRKMPTVTNTKSEVLDLIEKCAGATVKAVVTGSFRMRLTELPEKGVIRSLSTESGSAGMRLRLTAGTLSLSGAPIRQIRWSLGRTESDEGQVTVHIEAEKSLVVSGDYLAEALAWIESQKNLFLLG
jgi:hypothetical protein